MRISFIGIGSAWNIWENNTSAFIKKCNKMILIDCGETIAREIIKKDLLSDINDLYILISHTHSDHVGSLGTLLFYSKYKKNIKNNIVLPDDIEFNTNFREYLRLVYITSEVEYVNAETLINEFDLTMFQFLRANHVKSIPCYCFVLQDSENLIYYSADNNNLEYIKKYIRYPNAQIYTEICDNPRLQEEHLLLEKLENAVEEGEKRKISLMHINETIEIENLKKAGFNIPVVEEEKKKIWEKKLN